MPRPLRIEYPGAIYHVMSRGDRREMIFLDDGDRDSFLEGLGQACAKTGWQVHAYVLMGNHFHLVLETPQPNLCLGMKWLLGTFTQRWNRRRQAWGHLFGGRYKAQCIDERSPPKSHPLKVRLAHQLRTHTPMTRAWITHRLRMGSPSYLSALLSVHSKN